MPEIEIKLKGFKCERCSHEWIPRQNEKPIICPKCKSPYWDMVRKDVKGYIKAKNGLDKLKVVGNKK